MLVTGSQLEQMPIMSLQTGTLLATAEEAIIDPNDLSIKAYEVEGPNLDVRPSLLLIDDIRELSTLGMIIDSNDEFVSPEDIIKIEPLYEMKYTVLHKHVIDQDRHKIGKVIDYTVDADSFIIQQLSVKRPLFKSLKEAELLIHRSQIVEINDTQIIVKSTKRTSTLAHHTKGKLKYANPFRQNAPQTNAVKAKSEN